MLIFFFFQTSIVFFFKYLLNTMFYLKVRQKLTEVKMIEVIVLKFISSKYVILC